MCKRQIKQGVRPCNAHKNQRIMKKYFRKEKPNNDQIIGFKAKKAFYPEIGVFQTFDNGNEEVYIPANDDVEKPSQIEYWFEVPQK